MSQYPPPDPPQDRPPYAPQDRPSYPASYLPPYAPSYHPPFPPNVAVSNGLGTAGLVLGIVGLVLVWVPGLNLLLGILATTFGGVGYSKARKGTATNGGSAIAGLTMGIITVLVAVLFLMAVAGASAANAYY